MFLLLFLAAADDGSSFIDGLHEKYEPIDEHVEVVAQRTRNVKNQKKPKAKNNLKPAFPEKSFEDEYFKKAPIEYDEIFDEFSVEKENPEVQASKQGAINVDDFYHYTRLLSITPYRLVAGKSEEIIFELQPTSFKFGYGRFGESIVQCNSDAQSRMICPSPKLNAGEIKVSFSRDNVSWTNTVPAFVYRTSFMFQWVLTFIIFILGIGGLVGALYLLNGRTQPKFNSRKPAALSSKQINSEVV